MQCTSSLKKNITRNQKYYILNIQRILYRSWFYFQIFFKVLFLANLTWRAEHECCLSAWLLQSKRRTLKGQCHENSMHTCKISRNAKFPPKFYWKFASHVREMLLSWNLFLARCLTFENKFLKGISFIWNKIYLTPAFFSTSVLKTLLSPDQWFLSLKNYYTL